MSALDEHMHRINPADFLVLRSVPSDNTASSEPVPTPEPTRDRGCPKCDWSGYYKEAVPFGHPHFGVLFTCECLVTKQAGRAADLLRDLSNLNEMRHKTFATYDRYVPGVDLAFRKAQAFARNPRGWLTFLGGYGCGKTHLLAAIGNELLDRGVAVYLGIAPDLLDHLRASFRPESTVTYDALFERLKEIPVLCLDDLGTEAATAWAKEKLFQLLNHRYNYQLPTVLSSNRRREDLEGRIESRFSDEAFATVVELTKAGDYRKRKLAERTKPDRTQKGNAA